MVAHRLTDIQDASEPNPVLYIYHCIVRLRIFYAEPLCPGSGLVESQTQHFLHLAIGLWRDRVEESDSVFYTLSLCAVYIAVQG